MWRNIMLFATTGLPAAVLAISMWYLGMYGLLAWLGGRSHIVRNSSSRSTISVKSGDSIRVACSITNLMHTPQWFHARGSVGFAVSGMPVKVAPFGTHYFSALATTFGLNGPQDFGVSVTRCGATDTSNIKFGALVEAREVIRRVYLGYVPIGRISRREIIVNNVPAKEFIRSDDWNFSPDPGDERAIRGILEVDGRGRTANSPYEKTLTQRFVSGDTRLATIQVKAVFVDEWFVLSTDLDAPSGGTTVRLAHCPQSRDLGSISVCLAKGDSTLQENYESISMGIVYYNLVIGPSRIANLVVDGTDRIAVRVAASPEHLVSITVN